MKVVFFKFQLARRFTSPFALFLIFLCISLQHCVVEEEPVQVLNTTGESITKAPWKLISYMKRKTISGPWIEFASDSTTFRGRVGKCYPDDVYTFKSNGVVVRDNGLISCFQGENTSDTGAWKLDETNKKLTLTFFGIPVTWTISELTTEKLQLETPTSGEYHQAIFSH